MTERAAARSNRVFSLLAGKIKTQDLPSRRCFRLVSQLGASKHDIALIMFGPLLAKEGKGPALLRFWDSSREDGIGPDRK